jgi:hypothetical protein
MVHPGHGAGAVEEAPICGDAGTVQFHFHREGEEGGVIGGEVELPAQSTTIFAAYRVSR